MASYMKIQRRLLRSRWDSGAPALLERKILKDKRPENIEEFRAMVPLDYL